MLFIVLCLFISNKLCYGHVVFTSKYLGLGTAGMGQALRGKCSCLDSTQLWGCLFDVNCLK